MYNENFDPRSAPVMMAPGNPYQPTNMQQPQVQNPEYIMGHFNRDELNMLDQMQGGRVMNYDYGSPMRSYTGVSNALGNPEIYDNANRIQGYATGGMVSPNTMNYGGSVDAMSDNGRHGDTEMALITPDVYNNLVRMNGGKIPSTNPNDGQPEFFDFLSALLAAAPFITQGIDLLKHLPPYQQNLVRNTQSLEL